MRKFLFFLIAFVIAMNGWAQLSLPVFEDFEGEEIIFENGATNSVNWAANTSFSYGGDGTSYANIYTASNTNTLEMVESVTILEGSNPMLTFWHIASLESCCDHGYVEISTDGGTTWTTLPDTAYLGASSYSSSRFNSGSYSGWSEASNTLWKMEVFSLGAYTGEDIKIRFKLTTDSSVSYDGWFIDNVNVFDETCAPPTEFTLADVAQYEATVSWTAGDEEAAWIVEIGEPGFFPGVDQGTVYDVSENTLTINDLAALESYDVYVRANCDSDSSLWEGPISFTTLPSCPNPYGLIQVADGTTTSSATLSWSPTVNPINWDEGYTVQYKTINVDSWDDESVTTVTAITDTFLAISDLAAGTYYDARLISVCAEGDTSANWQYAVFTTLCSDDAITTFPFEEGFELPWAQAVGSDHPSPLCWTVIDRGGLNGSYEYWWKQGTGSYSRTGNGHAQCYTDYGDTDHNDWLVTPKLALTGEQRMSFWARRMTATTSEPDEISIFISDEDITIDTTGMGTYDTLAGFTRIFNQLLPVGDYAKYTVDLSEYSGNRYIAFVRQGTDDGYYLRLDDVLIEYIPACLMPTALTSANATETSVDLGWTTSSPDEDYAWVIQYRPQGTSAWLEANADANPYTLTDLTASTVYEWRVRVDCQAGIGELSPISIFATACAAVDVPWSYGFEDAWETSILPPSNEEAPFCWVNLDLSNDSYEWERTTSTSYVRTGTGAGYLYSSNSSTPENDWLITPALNLTGNEMLSFYAKNVGSNSGYGSHIAVYILNVEENANIADVNAYEELLSVSNLSQEWNLLEVLLTEYVGTYHLAFVSEKPASTYSPLYTQYLGIDDITVGTMPECPSVSAITVNPATTTSISVSWTQSTSIGVGYVISYATDVEGTFDPDNGTQITLEDGETLPYIIDGFEAGQTVWVAVQQNCGAEWSPVVSTTLPAGAFSMPVLIDFEDETLDEQIELVNGSQTNKWYIGEVGANNSERGAYISNDNGATNAYTISSTSTVHLVSVVELGDAPEFLLSFDWKAYGESSSFDYINAYLVPLNVTVAAGSQVSALYKLTSTGLNQQSTWQTFTTTIPGNYANGVYQLVIEWWNDSSAGTDPPASIDNISITAIACGAPFDLEVDDVETTTAIVEWTDLNSETMEWLVQYRIQGEAAWTNIVASEIPCPLADLLPGTRYEARVATVCSVEDTSFYTNTVAFQTECVPETVPTITETFDNSTFPPTVCWAEKTGTLQTAGTASNPSGTTSSWVGSVSSNPLNTGSQARVYISSSTDEWLIMPTVNLGEGTATQLEFDLSSSASSLGTSPRNMGSTDDRFAVVISTDNGLTWDATNAWIWNNNGSERVLDSVSNNQQHVIIPLWNANEEPYSGDVKIAFYMESTIGSPYNYLFIDNVEVQNYNPCSRPYQLAATAISSTEATFEWNELGEPEGYEYVVAEYSEENDPNSLSIETISADEYPLVVTGLDENTEYQLWVRGSCGGDSYSEWSLIEFQTTPMPAVLPYSNNMEDEAENSTWRMVQGGATQWVNGTAAGNGPSIEGTTSTYISGDGGATNTTGSESMVRAYYYRDIDFGAEPVNYTINFDYKVGGYILGTSVYAGMAVYLRDLDDCDMPTNALPTYVNDQLDFYYSQEEWETAELGVTEVSGVKRLIFLYFQGSTPYVPAAIDNIVFTPMTCVMPTILSAVPTENSADITFTETGADSYEILYVETADPDAAVVIETATSSPYTIMNLDPITEYAVAVRGICGTDTSLWSNTEWFTTTCSALPLPTEVEEFNTFLPNECWEERTGMLEPAGTLSNLVVEDGDWMGNVNSNPNNTGSAARINNYSTGREEWIISPTIDLGAGSELNQIEFDVALCDYDYPTIAPDQNGTDDRFAVVVSLDNGATWDAANATIWDNAGSDSVYNDLVADQRHMVIPLVNADGVPYSGLIRVGFYAESTLSNADNDLYVDNFEVTGEGGGTTTPCDMPTGLVASNVTDNSADLTWNGGEAAAWQVRLGTAGDLVDVTATTYDLIDLASSTEYTAYVRTSCDGGAFSEWASVTFTTTGEPCDAPTNVEAVTAGPTSIDVTWTGDAVSYNVQYREGVSGAWTTTNTTANSYTIEGLIAGTGYQIQVQSVCAAGESPYAPEQPISVTTETQMFVVTATAHGEGTIDPSGTSQYNAGATPLYTFTPNAGAIVERLEVSGVVTPFEDNQYQFPALTQNESIDVYFEGGSGINENGVSAIQLYPNPATSHITLVSDNIMIEKIEILDMTGRIVMRPEAGQSTIDIHNMEQGVYFARIITQEGVVTLRFIKQ